MRRVLLVILSALVGQSCSALDMTATKAEDVILLSIEQANKIGLSVNEDKFDDGISNLIVCARKDVVRALANGRIELNISLITRSSGDIVYYGPVFIDNLCTKRSILVSNRFEKRLAVRIYQQVGDYARGRYVILLDESQRNY